MNSLDDLGPRVDLSLPRPVPPHVALPGQHVTLVPMEPGHAPGFFACFTRDEDWLYLGNDMPYADLADAQARTKAKSASRDPLPYTVLMGGKPVGFCTLMRITPEQGVIETGYIHFSPALQGSIGATEAQYLMMRHVFDDLGYRRYEWKCNALNMPSRRAAERLGFTFEGIFRQHMVVKGRNRDTAWFSILDHEWPAQKARFERWLSADNFDDAGHQKARLQDF